MAKERSLIAKEDIWDLTSLYPSFKEWQEDLKKFTANQNPLTQLAFLAGKLSDDIETFLKVIDLKVEIDRELSKLYVYAHLKHDEDLAHQEHKGFYDQIRNVCFQFESASSFLEPEILHLKDEILEKYKKDKRMEPYKLYLEKITRLKAHTLSSEKEHLLSLATKALHAPAQIFSAYNNADLTFEKIADSSGNMHELSLGLYSLYMQSEDRVLRKNAFEALHEGYKRYENTIAEMLSGHIESHVFQAKARGYKNCLEAALFPNQIDPNVVKMLIDTVKKNISCMHDYVSFRKEYLELDQVHGYDMYVSCVSSYEYKVDFEKAVDITLQAVDVLGSDYQKTLRKGLIDQRWVDRYENARKRSGAYSSGCYDSNPYILMNFQGTLNDLMTLAHEAGHSMHSFLSDNKQPYQYSQYSIFVAEVASTFNEELVFRHLLEHAKTEEETLFLLNQKIDGIRATLFRQTLFAEFEWKMHELAEKGVPLTVSTLRDLYISLNKEYYGPDFCADDAIQYEFLRIPHFYSNFYVYQYATGISAAFALVEDVCKTKDPSRYLEFLSSGSSDYPVSLLKKAGVDMLTELPVQTLIDRFTKISKDFQEKKLKSKELNRK